MSEKSSSNTPNPTPMTLASFLAQVSKAVIEAQQELNRQSALYNEGLPAGVPPSCFAIPSARADLRFGFRNLSHRGMDIILFSTKEEKESYSESSIRFELVATPPAPLMRKSTKHPKLPKTDHAKAIVEAIDGWLEASALHPSTKRAIRAGRETAIVSQLDDERWLVLWPATARGSTTPDTWSHMTLFVWKDGTLDPSWLEHFPDEGFLRLASRSTLLAQDPKQLVDLIESLGDLLLQLARRYSALEVLPRSMSRIETPGPQSGNQQ
ncbi:MAG: hypothetical protein NZV14_06170 [Bryobacteraceae bacterium]|nr:hypothetical protein [Bryobacteraceae bacterium]MDW8377727.1 hypothetical protein [Bryobacterales bacterium]